MAKFYNNILETIGKTPLVKLQKLSLPQKGQLFAKVESFNPGSSAKDRPALTMVDAAEKSGALKPGGTIIEPTSGNTGIGLAVVAAVRGYRLILVMPDTMSIERRLLAAAYGAEIVLTPGAEGMKGSVAKAEELHRTTPNSIIPQQFENPANPLAHYETTGPEIWEALEGKVDAFVATFGTGGTITGVAKYLLEKNPNIHIVGVEPADSPLLSQGKSAPHQLQGIGANFIPGILDKSLIHEIITATTEEAGLCARECAQKEGILVGISSGAALHAAKLLAARPAFAGKNIVVLLPDSGERYLSTWLFQK